MIFLLSTIATQSHEPVTMHTLTALSVIVAGFALAAVIRLRHTPAPATLPTEPARAPTEVTEGLSAETLAIIAACVAISLGDRARILTIRPKGFSIEMLMPPWSLEGRRQIYSSHQFR